MTKPVGIRFSKEFLEKIEKLSKEEMIDRSTIIRKLTILGYSELIKKKSAEKYNKGEVTFSQAAFRAGMTLFEFEEYLVSNGFKSDYSIEDLEQEIKLLK